MMRLLEQLLRNPYKFKIGDPVLFVEEQNGEERAACEIKYLNHFQQTLSV